MKRFACFLSGILIFEGILYPQSIKVNQLGYLPGHSKYAWVNDLRGDTVYWQVKKASDHRLVYSAATPVSVILDSATGERVTRLNFSSLNTPGNYYIEIPNTAVSAVFPVSDHAYNEVWKAGVKSYYYQRSGMDLEARYAGIWARKASHTKDAKLYHGFANGKIIEGEYRNCRGGWYDAGDFGKKIVPASIAMYAILKMAALFPEKVRSVTIDIPNTRKSLPSLLAEAKWELDWFFSMQEKNGPIHHLIVSPDFFMGPAQDDTLPRYITGISSTATADFAATMAMAYTAYKPYLPSYADSCLAAAEKAWKYLQQNPDIFPAGGYNDPEGIHATGAYEDPRDQDERLWAAAELFNATGKKEYLESFEKNCAGFRVESYGWWQDPHNYAFFTYLLSSQPGRNPELVKKLENNVHGYASKLKDRIESSAYGVALLPKDYFWGSNSYVLNYGMELMLINKIFKTGEYTEAALQQLNYILGCNSLNLSFVCNYGSNPVRDPHQSINSYDTLSLAPPGFIPGGPNQYPQDPFLKQLIASKNPPPAKCYVDRHWAYACNEVCLCYTSGFIFLAGYFLKPEVLH